MSNIPEEAVEAALPTYRLMHPCGNGPVPVHCAGCYYDLSKILAAAAPHLRAETVDRLKNFRNDYQHTYAIPGDPYADGYLTACNAIIALLEGGAE